VERIFRACGSYLDTYIPNFGSSHNTRHGTGAHTGIQEKNIGKEVYNQAPSQDTGHGTGALAGKECYHLPLTTLRVSDRQKLLRGHHHRSRATPSGFTKLPAGTCATAAFSWLPGTTMQMRGVQGTVYNTLSLTNPAQDVSRVHANQRVLTHTACRQTWFSGRDDMTCFPTVMAMIGLAPSNTWQRYHPFSSGT